MMRGFALVLTGMALAAKAAAGCDLDLAQRGTAVADYVEAVGPCLVTYPDGYRADADMEQDFLDRLNAERTQRGLTPLRLRAGLVPAARFQSLDMAYNDFFGHSGPDGRTVSGRVAAFDRRALIQSVAENVAMVSVSGGYWNFDRDAPGRLHQNLMDSEGHRHNILNPDVTDVAIGVVRTRHGVWLTQVFMELAGTLPQDLPVRMSAGETVRGVPALREWTFGRYEAERGAEDFVPLGGGVPAGMAGDFGLTVYATMPGETRLKTYHIRLPGPAVTVGGSN